MNNLVRIFQHPFQGNTQVSMEGQNVKSMRIVGLCHKIIIKNHVE